MAMMGCTIPFAPSTTTHGQTHQRAETSGTTRNYLTDALGSTLALTSGMATPTVNTEYTYEPYGKPTTTGTATTNPFAFAGLVWDGGSGLYDNRFRQLNQRLERMEAFVTSKEFEIDRELGRR